MDTELSFGTGLSQSQATAINAAADLGRRLQDDFPGIAGRYRGGEFTGVIAEDLRISGEYGVSDRVARVAVRYAISGYPGGLGIDSYLGLITDESELEELASEHKRRNSRETGRREAEEGIGVHGRSKEERRSYASKAGKVGGAVSYERRVGIHGQSREERRERALASHRARGLTPWSEEEAKDVLAMMEDPGFTYQTGNHRGKRNAKLIARTLNERYHGGGVVRTNSSVQFYYKSRKK